MIRALGIGLGLAIGLALALGLGGQVGHLRAAGLAPGWMAGLADDAGLRAGQGEFAGAHLRWRFDGLDAAGPRWAATLQAADWQTRAVLRADLAGLRIEAVEGLLPGAVLAEGGAGLIVVQEGALRLRLATPIWRQGRLSGLARGLRLGALQGEGQVSLVVTDGVWSH